MVSAVRHRRRGRLLYLLVPGIVGLYLAMIPLNLIVETDHVEVFPFFRWTLFTEIPDWAWSEYALVIDAIDGEPPAETSYLIPGEDIRDLKVLEDVAITCAEGRGCEEAVNDVLYPIVQRAFDEQSIDFSIVEADVDLDDVRTNITDLAEGRLTRTDFFRLREVIVRWNTRTGRSDPAAGGG